MVTYVSLVVGRKAEQKVLDVTSEVSTTLQE